MWRAISCTLFINDHSIRHMWVVFLEKKIQSSSFEAADHQMRMFVVGEAVAIHVLLEVPKCQDNGLVGAPENFSSLKRFAIELDFLEKVNCMEELAVDSILTGVPLVGLIGIHSLAS